MTIIIPRSATWVIWPCVLALASVLAFALGWSMGVDNGRSWAAREIEPEIQANRVEMATLADRLIYLEEAVTMTTTASFYGGAHHGKLTASGEPFDRNALTAASPWLPFGSRWTVRRLDTGAEVTGTINDRGPHPRLGRGLDLSEAAARELDMFDEGVVKVSIRPGL